MKHSTLTLAVVGVATVLGFAPGPSQAACPSSSVFRGVGTAVFHPDWPRPGVECYTYGCYSSPLGDAHDGGFWALGSGDPKVGSGNDSGRTGVDDWLHPRQLPDLPYYYYPGAGVHGDWAGSYVDGCIAAAGVGPLLDGDECTALLIGSSRDDIGYFALATRRILGSTTWFDEDITFAELPKPSVVASTSLGRAEGGVQVEVTIPPLPESGFYFDPDCDDDVVIGYKVYQATLDGSDPAPAERRRWAWTPAVGGEGPRGSPLPLGGTADLMLCSVRSNGDPPAKFYLATSFVTESGFETPFVSRNSSQISCDGCGPQADLDSDGVANGCDNCRAVVNPGQTDLDFDREGDICDEDDDSPWLAFSSRTSLGWQRDAFDTWNLYRGDLDVLRDTGVYSQVPGSNPSAFQECGRPVPGYQDVFSPDPGRGVFYLITGVSMGQEGGLGLDSTGATRPSASPCP